MAPDDEFEIIDQNSADVVDRPGYLRQLISTVRHLSVPTKLAIALGLLLAQAFSLNSLDVAVGTLGDYSGDYAALTAIPSGVLALASLAFVISGARDHRASTVRQTAMLIWAPAALGVWAGATLLLDLIAGITGLTT